MGFRRGSYKCICRKGFYYPDPKMEQRYFNGSTLEEEYAKLMQVRLQTNLMLRKLLLADLSLIAVGIGNVSVPPQAPNSIRLNLIEIAVWHSVIGSAGVWEGISAIQDPFIMMKICHAAIWWSTNCAVCLALAVDDLFTLFFLYCPLYKYFLVLRLGWNIGLQRAKFLWVSALCGGMRLLWGFVTMRSRA